jgi:uncharacterized protein
MDDNFTKLEAVNFWNGLFPDLGYIRKIYINRIAGFSGTKLVKVLVGQRRTGKSFLMRQIIRDLIDQGTNPNNVLYINKEYTQFDGIENYTDLASLIETYRKTINPVGKIHLFIDEIQNISGWERLVNALSQSYPVDYEIFISGSNSELLSGELATLLSGRYIEFLVMPFNYYEYCDYKGLESSKPAFIRYLKTGGLPELFHLSNDESMRQYVSAVKDTILLRDIIQRHHIKDSRLLEDIFAFLLNNASNLVSINTLVNYFKSKNRKTNYETVSNYITYLHQSYLVHRVERYNIKGKELLAGNNKYYSNDISFRNYLYPGSQYGAGYLLENVIYLYLLNSGFNVYTGHMRNKEIDFVAIRNDRIVYLQSCYLLTDEVTIEREYSPLKSVPDNYEKYVVSMDEIALPNRDGIKNILAWELDKCL